MDNIIIANDGVLSYPIDAGNISDGYHTFNELYEHRAILFIALMRAYHQEAWKSVSHSDGSAMYEGYFLAGIKYLPGEQMTYHLPIKYWNELKVIELKTPPPFDGHTPSDVLERLKKL